MTTLLLKYNRRRRAFNVQGTDLWFGPAASVAEFDDVAEYLGRRLCDNPDIQMALGVLGDDVVNFELAA